MNKEQTVDEIVNIISSVIETEITGGFTTHRMPGIGDTGFWGDEYYEGDLTKSYLKLVKDIFNLKYGVVTRNVVECFGDSIRTGKDQFKSSYKTTIKEIIPGKVYIHTSMNKLTIRKMINSLGKSLDFRVTHRYSKSEQDEKIVNETLNRITSSDSDLPF